MRTKTQSISRRIFSWLLRLALVIAVMIGGLLLWAYLSTGTSLVARGILWGDSDAGDLYRFPARPVNAAASPVYFDPPAEDILSHLEVTAEALQEGQIPFATLLEQTNTTAFLVLHGDRLLYEAYFNGSSREAVQGSFSVAKSFTSTLIGIAVQEGLLHSLDDPITAYLPELLERDPRFAEITIRHLLTMTSGLRWDRSESNPFSDDFLTYYAPDLRATALQSEIVEPPGQRFVYNDYNPILLGMILERAAGMTVSEYMATRLWQPMGAEADGSWSLDSERSGFEKMFVGVNGRAIDLIKLGWLFLNGGRNGSAQVVPSGWVAAVSGRENPILTGRGSFAEYYQYSWWWDADNDAYYAEGDKCQFIYVYPKSDLVLARFGTDCGGYVFGIGWMAGVANYLAAEVVQR